MIGYSRHSFTIEMSLCTDSTAWWSFCSALWPDCCGFNPEQTSCNNHEEVVLHTMPLVTVEFGTSVSWELNDKSCDVLVPCLWSWELSIVTSRAKERKMVSFPAIQHWAFTVYTNSILVLFCVSFVIYVYFFWKEIMKVRQWIRCMALKEKSNLSILFARCCNIIVKSKECCYHKLTQKHRASFFMYRVVCSKKFIAMEFWVVNVLTGQTCLTRLYLKLIP